MRSKFKWIFTLTLAFMMQFSYAQEKTITGTVTGDGMPLPGATIVVKNTTNGVQSDFDGNYSIKANVGDVIEFSYVGYKKVSSVVGASSVINVSLEDDTQLDEVIVTGFVQRKSTEISSAVGKVTSAELEKLAPMTTIDNMLQGKIAGVQVVANGGRPGQPARIMVRGANGLSGSGNPLYVVDGVFMTSTEMVSINPADIESQVVLKDAAASSLYGARAANGVIVITTKSAKAGKTSYQFNSSYSITERVDDGINMMNATQFLDMQEKLRSVGFTNIPIRTPEERQALIRNGTNWEKEIFRTGFIRSNSFQVSSGTETTSLFASLSTEKNDGLVRPWDGLERLTGRIKIDHKMRSNVTLGANVAMSYTSDDRPRESSNVLSPIFTAFRSVPIIPVYQTSPDGNLILDPNGNPIYNTAGLPNNLNYFDIYDNYKINTRQFRTFGNVYLKVDDLFIKGLSAKTEFAGVYTRDVRETFVAPNSNIGNAFGLAEGNKRDSGFDDLDYRWVNTLNYNKTFGKNSIDATLFSELNKFNRYSYLLETNGFSTNFLTVQSVGTTPFATSTSRLDYLTIGYGLNIGYVYDEKYILEGSVRRDGNSRLGVDNKTGFFVSGSVAWRLGQEEFFKNIQQIDDLKLRLSWGQRGSVSGLAQTYASTNVIFPSYNNTPGAAPSLNIAASNLGWSVSETTNFGVEFALLGRLTGTFDIFNDKRSGFYFNNFLPVESGSFRSVINAGEFVNKGFEISLNYDIIKNQNFRWSVFGNYTNVKNKINNLFDVDELFDGGGNINRVGQMLNSFFLVRYAGVNPSNGDALYYDVDGNITNIYNGSDAVLLENKSPNPTFYGGFGTSFNIYDFDLAFDFSYQGGNYIYNLHEAVLTNPSINNMNFRSDAVNFWVQPGDVNVLPSPFEPDGSIRPVRASDQFLQKGDFIRFRTLNFGYTLRGSKLPGSFIDSVRIYVQGQNLYTWTKFAGDPEVGIFNAEDTTAEAVGSSYYFPYPNTKSYTFGVQVKF